MDVSSQLFILLDVVIAMVLAGVIGYERGIKDKPAGFRTHMIVGGASCLLFSLGLVVIDLLNSGAYGDFLRIDLIRVIEAIVVGISFIGAGTILKSNEDEKIYYLTTAATILFSTAIGIAVALEQYVLAVGVTLLILLINTGLRVIDKKKNKEIY